MTVKFITIVTFVGNNIPKLKLCLFAFGKNLYGLYNISKQIKHFIGTCYNILVENYWACGITIFFLHSYNIT